jgi:hypothetical protein
MSVGRKTLLEPVRPIEMDVGSQVQEEYKILVAIAGRRRADKALCL